MHDPARQTSVATVSKDIISASEKLCFDKNEFMKANFSVDEFLHKNRSAPSLEQLRDNLGLYLKGLRASMIDLINEDYADFVSLSANLVGLDQTIETIQRPLEQFRDDIESIHCLIQENATEIREQLEGKRQLRELKRNLQSLKKVYETIQKLNELLSRKLNGEQPIQAVHLERAALDMIQLKFNEKYCAAYLKEEQFEEIRQLEDKLLQKLRIFFKNSLKSANSACSENLERCLRIYITLDCCDVAERVFREDIVAPFMSSIISEQNLQNSPQGLAGIYSKILNFISLHMTDLLRLTQYTDKLHGFNFVINSFWSDVEMRLELHMTSIFAPGNSEVFYIKYKCTRDFISKIEELLAGSGEQTVREFRQHKQTKSFQARWNLPVYFQICFQEIAGQFESCLEPLLSTDTSNQFPNGNENIYNLVPFNVATKSMNRCWAEGVYLVEVFPKFFKLNVQILIRLCRWIADVLQLFGNDSSKIPLNKTLLLVALHGDIRSLNASLPAIQQLILNNVPHIKQIQLLNETIKKSFDELRDMLSASLLTIQQKIVQLLIIESGLENVRQVNDLPRLYRKTNRDVPSRCSAYVDHLVRPLKLFAAQHTDQLGETIVQEILEKVVSNITADYFNAVSEVLTSVQKTEESLRRLRNLKSGVTQAAGPSGAAMSDDDKIRLQLRVDVIAWTNELTKLHFMPTQIDKLLELNNIVEGNIKLND